MATEHGHDLHRRNVCVSVPEIDHLLVRNPFLFLGDTGIHLLAVVGAEYSFVYLEYVLRLVGVVHRYSRPFGLAFLIVHEGAGENVLEFLGDGGAFDDFLQTGRVDVMFDAHSVGFAIFIDQSEPLPDAFEQGDVLAEGAETALLQPDSVLSGLVEHHLHVGQDVAGILPDSETVTHSPELLGSLPHGLYETEFLHVAGRQGPVKIIDQSDNRFPFHFDDDLTIRKYSHYWSFSAIPSFLNSSDRADCVNPFVTI